VINNKMHLLGSVCTDACNIIKIFTEAWPSRITYRDSYWFAEIGSASCVFRVHIVHV